MAERFAVGLFIGGILPTANALIGRSVSRETRGTIYGMTASATFLGNSLGPLTGGGIAAGLGIRWVFVMTTAVAGGEPGLGLVHRAGTARRAARDRRQTAISPTTSSSSTAQVSLPPMPAPVSRPMRLAGSTLHGRLRGMAMHDDHAEILLRVDRNGWRIVSRSSLALLVQRRRRAGCRRGRTGSRPPGGSAPGRAARRHGPRARPPPIPRAAGPDRGPSSPAPPARRAHSQSVAAARSPASASSSIRSWSPSRLTTASRARVVRRQQGHARRRCPGPWSI